MYHFVLTSILLPTPVDFMYSSDLFNTYCMFDEDLFIIIILNISGFGRVMNMKNYQYKLRMTICATTMFGLV